MKVECTSIAGGFVDNFNLLKSIGYKYEVHYKHIFAFQFDNPIFDNIFRRKSIGGIENKWEHLKCCHIQE